MRRSRSILSELRVLSGIPEQPSEKKSVSDETIGKELIGELWDGTRVFLVDGASVRANLDVEFTEGGHGYVYDWIQKNEIWVERMVDAEDEEDIMIHEIVEWLMMKYLSIGYEEAHERSGTIESVFRLWWDKRSKKGKKS
jgi:hypothetical protein